MNDLDNIEITIFNSDNIPNPGLITFNLNGYDWYYMPQKIKTIGSNYVVWSCELDVYTTFIYRLYNAYSGSGYQIKTTRSQYITAGALNEDPLVKNFNFNGRWQYTSTAAPTGKYTYSWGSSGLNPVVYAIINTNTANNSSLTLIPILSKSNTVTITKPGGTSTVTLPKRTFVFALDNGDAKSVNALARNTNHCCYSATGPGDPGVRYLYASLGGNPNVSADKRLGFLELKAKGDGVGLDNSWIANTNGWGSMSYNYTVLRNLIQQYNQAGANTWLGIVNGHGNVDYTDVTKWPSPSDDIYGYWYYGTTLNGAEFDKIRVKYTFERSYLPNVKYGPHIEHIALEKSDGTTLKQWSTVRQEDGNYYSDMAQFYSTWTSGAPTQDFNTAIVLILGSTSQTSSTTVTNTVYNSWNNINNLLLNNYSNKVQGLFLGPPVTCFEDNFVFENLADGNKYLTLTLDKDGLPVRNYDFKSFEISGGSDSYINKFNFLSDDITNKPDRMPWWLELYLPKLLFNNKFNFAKFLYNQKLVNKNNNDLINKEDGYFTFNGTTNFILINQYDMPKDCIFQMSGQLPFYNDAFKQYVNSTTNSVNTGYEIAKQNQVIDIVGGVFNYISQGLGAMGAAMSGNIPGALAGVMGAYGSIKDMAVSGVKLQQQKSKIKAHYADQKNVKGATITNSLMTDVLNLVEWYKFSPVSFVGLQFVPFTQNTQALGELITINGFLTEQDTVFTSNFNVNGSYIETAPVLFAEEGLNKLINDQKFKNVIPTPYYQNVVHEFLSRVLTMKDMDD